MSNLSEVVDTVLYTEYVVLPPESAWKFRVCTGERSPLLSKRGTLKEENKNVFIVLHGVKKKLMTIVTN